MLQKPQRCRQIECPLATKGKGYAPADGPVGASIALVGEALGADETIWGRPFVGAAGNVLDKILRYANIPRDTLRIANCISCQPPGNWLENAPWEYKALQSCYPNLENVLNEPGIKVVVPLGATAIRRVLGIDKRTWKTYRKPLENFHGTIHRDPQDRFWVVPTFHPSFLLQGSMRMFGVLVHDLLLAKEIAKNGHTIIQPNLKVDPPIEWFMAFVRDVIDKSREFVAAGKDLPWLAVDIETPEKAKGIDESEVKLDDPSFIILRVNVATSFDPDLGITVPWSGPYIPYIAQLLACTTFRTAVWHQNYDIPRLRKNNIVCAEPIIDVMDAWHYLQTNLPKGLGFVTPFFSKYKYAWKHLSDTNPGVYAAWDGVQTIQDTIGIEKDLVANDQWYYFNRHGPMVDRYALKPAEEVGLLFDRQKVKEFQDELAIEVDKYNTEIKQSVPEELIPLEPKNGYKKPPVFENDEPNPDYFPVTQKVECYKCLACEKVDVTIKHRCKERKFYEAEHKKEPFSFNEWELTKWYTKGEFNPNSSDQILNYIRYKGHKPGKQKKTKNDSADAQAIERLAKKYKKDVVYNNLINLRKLSKVKSTYVDSVMGSAKKPALIDDNDRVHTIFCLTGEHEVLTAAGWVPLSLYNKKDEIVQWNTTKNLMFTKPLDFTETSTTAPLIELTGKKLNIVGTKNHRVPYYYRSSRHRESLFTVRELDSLPKLGRVPISGYLEGTLDWSNWVALAIAVQADGCIEHKRRTVRFTLRKKRKIKRLTKVLDNLGIKYSKYVMKCGYVGLRFKVEHCLPIFELLDKKTKTFKLDFIIKLTQKAKKQFLDEILEWDGYKGDYRAYFTTNKVNADIVQTLAHITGGSASVHTRPITELTRNVCYQVTLSNFNKTAIKSTVKTERKTAKSTRVYCPTVPWEFFLVRYKGTIYITGNTNNPSTWRTSSAIFNTQNQISAGKREDLGLGEKFRKCVIASPGCHLLEFDFAGIEAVEVGWFANDPSYMRLSKMSTHAFMASHMKGFKDKPAQLDWEDNTLREYLLWIKHNKDYKVLYNRAKRVVHGSGYGLTEKGLHLTYPEEFPTIKDALETLDLFFGLFPKIRIWQEALRKRGYEQLFIGGSDHPFKLKHWFFDIYNYTKISKVQAKQAIAKGAKNIVEFDNKWFRVSQGKDSKRVVAFYPQSTAGGIIREAMLRLFVPGSPWYIGDVFYGKTPLRMPIHDSLVLEVPKSKLDMVIEKTYNAMTHPVIQQPCPDEWNQGKYLTKLQLDYLENTGQLTAPRAIMEKTKYLDIGVEGEIGTNWGEMKEIDLGGVA